MNSSVETLKGRALILIDWGNTLMRDDPDSSEPMCNWSVVEAMPDAEAALRYMTAHFPVGLATGAAYSNWQQIVQALKRVGLDEWISVLFLAAEIGISKSSSQFYTHISSELEVKPKQLAMIGNDLINDVQTARQAGLHAFWVPEAESELNEREPRFTLMEAAEEAVEALHRELTS